MDKLSHKRLSEVYDDGHYAFREGQPIEACPYARKSSRGRHWLSGWYWGQNQLSERNHMNADGDG